MAHYDPPKAKILLAVSPERGDRLLRILAGHETTIAKGAAEAQRALHGETFGMVLLGVHFDESQMFAMLCEIRQHARYRKVPILCVLGERGRALTDIAIEGLDHAVKAMTANGFLDLHHFSDDDSGNGRIRRIIDYLIMIDGDLQHLARAQGQQHLAIFDERRQKASQAK
jgi:hypothetical protein